MATSDQAPAADTGRRRELGAFLRSRRERLAPRDVGLPEGARRRTPGLRREEVALLGGVGTTWYSWLEQGREVRPSVETLSALARALRLDPAERRHLFVLAGRPQPDDRAHAPEEVCEPLRRMLDSLADQPAYVIGRRWDVLAWNRAAEAVFGDYGTLDGDARNTMRLIFTDPRHRRLLVDWEAVARAALGQFRADSAKYAGDPEFERLIAHLLGASPEFREWWPRHEVLPHLSGRKRIRHPKAGAMVFEHTAMRFDDGTDRRMVVYVPLAEADTVAKLERLLRREGLAAE
ncbi:MAG TPA: helix-turn-helix transcriptional regulator [Inquilinus sp.]|nr:helix-turn-helix transcriptional regulator [Inquilinus sp.]